MITRFYAGELGNSFVTPNKFLHPVNMKMSLEGAQHPAYCSFISAQYIYGDLISLEIFPMIAFSRVTRVRWFIGL